MAETRFASRSVPRHLVRGIVGFGALAGAFALQPMFGPVSLLLVPLGLLVLRGCPACWTIGLVETLSRGRMRRRCADDGRCELTRSYEPVGTPSRRSRASDERASIGGS
ncbi:MAG TPA: hypothetical protein VLH10_03865 [Yinghuangia sp.]|uniref:hypothetical protein n=1 Tax=Yinghuangia sp. YIM S10712 TaxID=3436930 RepID=UPI002CFB8A80|nr:hypothetical protein [Yinghuangia sp.]